MHPQGLSVLLLLRGLSFCTAFVVEQGITTSRQSVTPASSTLAPPSKTTRKIGLAAVGFSSSDTAILGPHIPINENFPGLEQVYNNPNVYIVRNYLDADACDDMVAQASTKNMAQSPVAYAGWTDDFKDLFDDLLL